MWAVGERALAACHGADGAYDCYYSQWAGSDRLLGRVLSESEEPYLPLVEQEWEHRGSRPFPGLVETLDYLGLDAVYVLSSRGVTVALPVWFGLDTDGGPDDPSLGALVRVESVAEVRHVRDRVRHLKGALRDAVSAGFLPTDTGNRYEVALQLLVCSVGARNCWLPSRLRALAVDS